ncbi:MAG TPA: C1 family peptidase, partial [Candidatus Hydrogenedentes bacterium]|nr:C1 family peptidase [Candidatus Hydrogenedentota bacterium]
MSGIKRVWAVFGAVCLLAAGALAQGAPGLSPLNPAFEAWQAGKSADSGHGYLPSPVDWSHLAPFMAGKADPPASYNLRTLGFVTPVKNQSVCGACWSFAACGVLEAWLKRFEATTWDFSENHMKNTHGFDWSSCDGGNNDIANAYLTRGTGPLNEADDPYNATVQTAPAPGAAVQKLLTRSRVFSLGTGGDRTAVKNALMEHGALSIPMTWNDAAYDDATDTYYYSGDGMQPGDGGHMVTLVGWDDAKAVPGAPGPGAWYCKNSWSSGWGDGGYFHISYHDTQAISEAYAFTDIAAPTAYGRVYQHDPLGMTSGFGYTGLGVIFGASVFTAAETGEIAAVGTYARVPGMQLQ